MSSEGKTSETAELSVAEEGRIVWEGIPKNYWPHRDRPWRASWGFGVHEDYATFEEAQAKVDELRATLKGGWERLVNDPFNAVEIKR